LRIRELVDAACPVRDVAELTHGQVIVVSVHGDYERPEPALCSRTCPQPPGSGMRDHACGS
jgi:hypothetical protein